MLDGSGAHSLCLLPSSEARMALLGAVWVTWRLCLSSALKIKGVLNCSAVQLTVSPLVKGLQGSLEGRGKGGRGLVTTESWTRFLDGA